MQGHVGVAGVDRAAAVADNAACAVHHGVFAVVADRAERRAVDDRGIVARPADDPARAGIAALGRDLHVRPGVAHQALAAVIADDTADVGVVVVTGRIADDRAADPAAVDHAAVAGAGRQNGDCRVFIRGLVVDERILDAQVADRTALADKAEEAGILIRGGLGFRADGQAGDRVVVAVEDAVEAAAVAADRRPALAGEVEIGVERNILARVGLTTVDRGSERLDLVDRADQIRVRLRAGAGGKDQHPVFLQMAQCPAVNVVLANFGNAQPGQDPRLNSKLFQSVLQIKSVHDGSQHADLVGNRTVQPFRSFFGAAENVAAADDQADFHAEPAHFPDLRGQRADYAVVHAERLVAHQAFARKLQQNTFI